MKESKKSKKSMAKLLGWFGCLFGFSFLLSFLHNDPPLKKPDDDTSLKCERLIVFQLT